MNKHLALSALVAAILAAPAAHAADDIDLAITGTIRPSACVPTLSGGGIADFAMIPAQSLSPTLTNDIGQRQMTLTVTCAAPARWALSATDMRAGTARPTGTTSFGLGQTSSGENIGFYRVIFSGVLIDGAAGVGRWSVNNGVNWGDNLSRLDPSPRALSGFALVGATVPAASTVTTATVSVDAFIGRADGLTLTDAVPLDGLASISIVYF